MIVWKKFYKSVTSTLCAVALISTSFAPWSVAFADDAGPTIDHTPPLETTAGQPFTLEANVSDESGVNGVWLYFRNADSDESWENNPMEEAVSGSGLYVYEFDSEELVPPGLDYYIQAEDSSENRNQEQDGFEFEPYRLVVNQAALASVPDVGETETKSNNNTILIGIAALLVVGALVGGGGDDRKIAAPAVFK